MRYRIALIPIAAFAGLQEAQTPAEYSIKDAIKAVARATRTEKAPDALRGFHVELSLRHKPQEGGQVFLEPRIDFQEPASMRVEVDVNKNRLVYVRDKTRLWMKNKGEVYSLAGKKEYKRDRQQANEYFEIARTLQRLLYPDRVIKEMRSPRGPKAIKWRINKAYPVVPAWEIKGWADDGEGFPLIQNPGYEGPQGLELLLNRKTHLPEVYRNYKIDAKTHLRTGPREELIFLKFQHDQELTFPKRWIKRIQNTKTGKLVVVQEMKLKNFKINPRFADHVFRRPGK